MHPYVITKESESASNTEVDENDVTVCILPSISSPPLQSSSPSSASTAYDPRKCSTLSFCLILFFVVILVAILIRSQAQVNATSCTVKSLLRTPLLLPYFQDHQSRQRRRPAPSAEAAVIAMALSLATPRGNGTDAEVPLATPRAPLLTTAELLTLQYYARNSMYVEWGSGASTTVAAPMARRAVSIENQKAWCDEMLASADVDFWINSDILTYICVDTGPTGAFGTPTGDANPEDFSRYLSALDEAAAKMMSPLPSLALKDQHARSPWKKRALFALSRWSLSRSLHAESTSTAAEEGADEVPTFSTNTFTVVLVDGRFRVACALKALWHLDHSRGVLLIHDWTQR